MQILFDEKHLHNSFQQIITVSYKAHGTHQPITPFLIVFAWITFTTSLCLYCYQRLHIREVTDLRHISNRYAPPSILALVLQMKIVKGQAKGRVEVPENVTPFCCSGFFVHHDIQILHETDTYKQKIP